MVEEEDVTIPEDGSSKRPLLTPKLEEESGKKRKLSNVGSTGKKCSDGPQESSKALTPSSTLPFSPTANTTFKAYSEVVSPDDGSPSSARRKSNRLAMANQSKKELKYGQ